MIASLPFLTLGTGHKYLSTRRDVLDKTMELLLPFVRAGGGPIPGFPGLTCLITSQCPGHWVITVWHDALRTPLVELALCTEDAVARDAWRECERFHNLVCIGPIVAKRPSGPWLLAMICPALALMSPEACMALGDFEKCVAWALLESDERLGSASRWN